MPDFVSLDVFLSPQHRPSPDLCGDSVEATVELIDECAEDPLEDPLDEALAAARRFRAALDEALQSAVSAIVREIAVAVVARELQLAPVDLAAIVHDARREYALEEALCVRAHPDETGALADLDLRVVADPRLRRGDIEIDLRDGTIDVTLGARLDRILPR